MPGVTTTTARTAGRSIYREKIIDAMLGVPVFFLLRQPLILNMHILGAAYFCALLPNRLRRTSGLVGALLAIIAMPNGQLRWKYGLIFLFVLGIDWIWRKGIREKQPVLYSICLASSLPLAVISLWMIRYIEAYHFFMTMLEMGVFYGCIRLYERSLRVLENQRYNAWAGMSDHLLEASCLIGTLLAAISTWKFWIVVPWQVLHIFLISVIAYRCHMGAAAIFTVVTVSILRLSQCCSEGYILLCLVFSIINGYFRDMGRLAQSAAGIASGILFLILFMIRSRPYETVTALLISQGIFGCIPDGWYQALRRQSELPKTDTGDTYKEHRIQRMENALFQIADAISDRPVQSRLSEKDMVYLCSDIAGRMCDRCPKHAQCWGSELHATYRVIGDVMYATQKHGKICRSDISGDFLKKCPEGDEFVRLVNRYFEIYRLNLSWENRLEKNLRLASMEMRQMAQQLMHLRTHDEEDREFENKLFRCMTGVGYSVSGIWVEMERERVRSVRIRLDQEKTHRSLRQVEEKVSSLAGYPMIVKNCHSCGRKTWEWEICEKLRYRLLTGVVSSSREDINGDAYVRNPLGYDQYLLALSDGMGTGKAAGCESRLALSLLEKLLEAGISEEEAVTQLNLILLLHNREETYTTLDLGLIHLRTGDFTLVKAGGAVSLIKSQGQVEILKAGTLPIGIIDDIDPSIYHRQLQHGDWILMMSDGIMDQVPDVRQAEMLLRRTLRGFSETIGPQQAAEELYETILEAYGSYIEDDITIMAARIVEEA